jgi:uncharacterized protein (DUF58 family)
MPGLARPETENMSRDLAAGAREWLAHLDGGAWRRFFLALFALALSLLMALYATALREAGHYMLAAAVAFLSLILAGLVAVKIVPRLVRRTALEHWVMRTEYQFTREGAVYIVIILVIGIAALNTGNNLLFIVLASLLAGILASGVLSRLVIEGLELKLNLPGHVFAGRPVVARLTLLNLKYIFPSFSITVSAPSPKRHRRKNTPSQPAPRQILDQPVYIPYLPHRSSVSQQVDLTFNRRGRYTQDGFRVGTKFPFSLLRKAHEVATRQEVLVLPSVQPVGEFARIFPFVGNQIESASKGHGHDLYAIRDYQESDAARHVDWKASAKAQSLKVREFAREEERRFTVIFDRRTPDAGPAALAQFEKAVSLCACLAWHFYQNDGRMKFLTEDFATAMSPAAEIVYPTLERLALIEPEVSTGPPGKPFWAEMARDSEGFRVIFTAAPRRSIPSGEWSSTHFVFMGELSATPSTEGG